MLAFSADSGDCHNRRGQGGLIGIQSKSEEFWQNEAKFTNVFNKPRSPSRLKVVARRANGCAGRLAGARPLHAHRMSDCARENRGVGCRVLMAIHAIAAGALARAKPTTVS